MDKQLSVKLPPSLTAETSVKIWEQVLGAESSGQTIFDASDLTFCDESGLTLLYELRSRPDAFKLINVSASIETLYNTMLKNFSPKPVEKKSLGVVSSLGKWLYDALFHQAKHHFFRFGMLRSDRRVAASVSNPFRRNSLRLR